MTTGISCRRTRGGALLAVLWLSAGLAAIALSVSSNVRSETDRVSTSGEVCGHPAYFRRTRAWNIVAMGQLRVQFERTGWLAAILELHMRRLPMRFPSGDALVEVIPES
jgi:hypothetical protein